MAATGPPHPLPLATLPLVDPPCIDGTTRKLVTWLTDPQRAGPDGTGYHPYAELPLAPPAPPSPGNKRQRPPSPAAAAAPAGPVTGGTLPLLLPPTTVIPRAKVADTIRRAAQRLPSLWFAAPDFEGIKPQTAVALTLPLLLLTEQGGETNIPRGEVLRAWCSGLFDARSAATAKDLLPLLAQAAAAWAMAAVEPAADAAAAAHAASMAAICRRTLRATATAWANGALPVPGAALQVSRAPPRPAARGTRRMCWQLSAAHEQLLPPSPGMVWLHATGSLLILGAQPPKLLQLLQRRQQLLQRRRGGHQQQAPAAGAAAAGPAAGSTEATVVAPAASAPAAAASTAGGGADVDGVAAAAAEYEEAQVQAIELPCCVEWLPGVNAKRTYVPPTAFRMRLHAGVLTACCTDLLQLRGHPISLARMLIQYTSMALHPHHSHGYPLNGIAEGWAPRGIRPRHVLEAIVTLLWLQLGLPLLRPHDVEAMLHAGMLLTELPNHKLQQLYSVFYMRAAEESRTQHFFRQLLLRVVLVLCLHAAATGRASLAAPSRVYAFQSVFVATNSRSDRRAALSAVLTNSVPSSSAGSLLQQQAVLQVLHAAPAPLVHRVLRLLRPPPPPPPPSRRSTWQPRRAARLATSIRSTATRPAAGAAPSGTTTDAAAAAGAGASKSPPATTDTRPEPEGERLALQCTDGMVWLTAAEAAQCSQLEFSLEDARAAGRGCAEPFRLLHASAATMLKVRELLSHHAVVGREYREPSAFVAHTIEDPADVEWVQSMDNAAAAAVWLAGHALGCQAVLNIVAARWAAVLSTLRPQDVYAHYDLHAAMTHEELRHLRAVHSWMDSEASGEAGAETGADVDAGANADAAADVAGTEAGAGAGAASDDAAQQQRPLAASLLDMPAGGEAEEPEELDEELEEPEEPEEPEELDEEPEELEPEEKKKEVAAGDAAAAAAGATAGAAGTAP